MKRELKLILNGRSGCNIEIIKKAEKTIVRKSSVDHLYNLRLLAQAKKQRLFTSFSVFKAPDVLFEKIYEPVFFDMEYIPGEKYSDFLTRLSKDDLDKYISYFINYLNSNLLQSTRIDYNPDIFTEKAKAIKATLQIQGELDYYLNQVIDSLMFRMPDSQLPVGNCHGDFTFSNMIFFNGYVYLVDFLDSFIDSPLIDLVKFKQDTQFKWTLLIDKDAEPYKINKTWQIMNYMDCCIHEKFCNEPSFLAWYTYLQKFNLLRILPYLYDKEEKQLIIKSLKSL